MKGPSEPEHKNKQKYVYRLSSPGFLQAPKTSEIQWHLGLEIAEVLEAPVFAHENASGL